MKRGSVGRPLRNLPSRGSRCTPAMGNHDLAEVEGDQGLARETEAIKRKKKEKRAS